MIEGLTKYETTNLKLKNREQDDLELVRIIRKMDELAKNDDVIPMVEVDVDSDDQGEKIDHEQLEFAEVKPYKHESWG